MQKIGDVILDVGSEFFNGFIAYYTDDIKITRFEVFDDLSKYDIMNTSTCLAAYYKDSKEFHYGNEELISHVLEIINTVSITPGVTERETDFTNGIITFKNKKTCTDGSVYTYTTVNGVVSDESYIKANGAAVNFSSVDASNATVLTPLNLGAYTVIGDLGSMLSDDSDELEYYTEEQLRSLYGDRMDHLYTYDFHIGESLEECFEWLDNFRKTTSKLVAIDIESTGLDVDMYGDDVIVSVGIAADTNSSMMFPFRQKGCKYNLPIWFFSEIADAVNNLPSTTRVGTFNGKMEITSFWKERPEHVKYSNKAKEWVSNDYEMYRKNIVSEKTYVPSEAVIARMKRSSAYLQYKENPSMTNHGINIRSDVDGFHISMKLDQRRGKGIHTLKSITTRITGKFWLELDQIFKGTVKFDVLPPNLIKLYAGADPCNTIRVIEHLEKELPKSMRSVTALEHELTYVKSENEYYGMRTDVDLLNKSIAQYTYMKDLLEKRIKEIHHTTKNIRSNNVKRDIFYNQLHAPVSIRTITGEPSTSKIALADIIEKGELPKDKRIKGIPDMVMFVDRNGFITEQPRDGENDKEKIVIISGEELGSNKYPSLLMFRKYSAVCKELGALQRIKKKSHNGCVMFYIISDGAESDRQTSDAHQYSDKMKEMILSDSEDHWLISCDYSQVELRVLAYVSGEEELMKLEEDPDIDIHRAILHIITGKPIYLISDKERKDGKQTNFGVVYGMSAFGLVKRRFGIHYSKEQLMECQKSIIDFYNGLPGVKKFCNESEELVLRDKQISTKFGYIRQFPQLDDPAIDKKTRSKVIKGANNTRIQGFAATLMKIAEVNYYKYIRAKGWDKLVDCNGVMLPLVRMMLSIHDEVLISAHKSIPVAEIIEMCKECQEVRIHGAPPFFASPAFVKNWHAGKSSKYEIPIRFRDKIIEEHKKGNEILDMSRYVEVLTEYRNGVLHDYMTGLIKKYKTAEEVTKHLDDPTLTHTLISVCIRDDEKLEHEEKIRLSVERYMEGHINEIVEEEKEDNSEYMDNDESIGKYIYYDDNGEQIVEYSDEETEAEDSDKDEEESSIAEEPNHLGVQETYTVYTMDSCLIDMTGVYRYPSNERVHSKIMEAVDKNPGAYELLYVIGNKIVDTNRKVSYIAEELDMIVQEGVLNKEVA